MKPQNRIAKTLIALSVTTLLAACAGPGPRPDSEMQIAASSIQQAEAADARKFDPVLLNQAQNKMADARQLIEQERYPEAKRLLEEAAVDAQLAAARSEAEKADRAVSEINRSIREMQNQLDGNQQ